MTTCTECNMEMEPFTKYIAGVFDAKARLCLFWACQHQPANDAPVRLASKVCVERFCEQHPECVDEIVALLSKYEAECRHVVN